MQREHLAQRRRRKRASDCALSPAGWRPASIRSTCGAPQAPSSSSTVAGRGALRRRQQALYAHRLARTTARIPIGVVIPHDARRRRRHARRRLPRVSARRCSSRGGGTSLSGETVNVAVVIDISKYLTRDRRDRRRERGRSRVEPGAINEQRQREDGPGRRHDLRPGSLHAQVRDDRRQCIGNNSCGIHSVHGAACGPGRARRTTSRRSRS